MKCLLRSIVLLVSLVSLRQETLCPSQETGSQCYVKHLQFSEQATCTPADGVHVVNQASAAIVKEVYKKAVTYFKGCRPLVNPSANVLINCTKMTKKVVEVLDCAKKVAPGTKASFKCRPGFVNADKHRVATCQSRKWSKPVITCKEVPVTNATASETTTESTTLVSTEASTESTSEVLTDPTIETATTLAETTGNTASATNNPIPSLSNGTTITATSTVVNHSTTSANTSATVANTSATAANTSSTVANISATVANTSATAANSSSTVASNSSNVSNATTIVPVFASNTTTGNNIVATTSAVVTITTAVTTTVALTTSTKAPNATTTAATTTTTVPTAATTLATTTTTVPTAATTIPTTTTTVPTAATTIPTTTTTVPTTTTTLATTTTTIGALGFTTLGTLPNKYKAHSSTLCWTDAQAMCVSEGGYLVILNNNYEVDMVAGYANTMMLDIIHIGYNDSLTEGTWRTSLGGSVPFPSALLWASNQPDNFEEQDCVYLTILGREMSDSWCSDRRLRTYICEKGP